MNLKKFNYFFWSKYVFQPDKKKQLKLRRWVTSFGELSQRDHMFRTILDRREIYFNWSSDFLPTIHLLQVTILNFNYISSSCNTSLLFQHLLQTTILSLNCILFLQQHKSFLSRVATILSLNCMISSWNNTRLSFQTNLL